MKSARLISLRLLGLAGAGLFAGFLILTYSVPGWVETFAYDFIEQELARDIDQQIDGLQAPAGESRLATFARQLQARNEAEIRQLKQALKERVHVEMANALALARELDCECRQKWEDGFRQGMQTDIRLLQAGNARLVDFIQSNYLQTVANLKQDIRLFTGTNTAVFLLVLLVSLLKPRAVAQLFLPTALLVLATVICTYFYVFEQNWLLTIIYNDFLGLAYLGYLGMVFAFLCDIAFNRARLTTAIINFFLQLIGAAASLLPC